MYRKAEKNMERNRQGELFYFGHIMGNRNYRWLERQQRRYELVQHDLNIMEQLARQGESQKLEKLLGELSADMKSEGLRLYSSNRFLNVILNDKAELADMSGVAYSVLVEDGLDVGMLSPHLLAGIVGGLIDRAIGAASECTSGLGKVDISLSGYKENILFYVKYTVKRRNVWKGGMFWKPRIEYMWRIQDFRNVRGLVELNGGTFRVEKGKVETCFQVSFKR